MKKVLIKILLKLLGKDTAPEMKQEVEFSLLASLYENPAFRTYLNTRENYLAKEGVDRIMRNKLDELKVISGQIYEVRKIRAKVRSAHLIISKSLKKERK